MNATTRPRGLTEPAADAAIDAACRNLRLPTMRGQFPELADAAARDQMTYRRFLAELLMAECDDRNRRRSERRIKAAGFPREKALRTFDFDANSAIDPAAIHTLASCDWIRKGLPLCLIGDSGTGKSRRRPSRGRRRCPACSRRPPGRPRSGTRSSARSPPGRG